MGIAWDRLLGSLSLQDYTDVQDEITKLCESCQLGRALFAELQSYGSIGKYLKDVIAEFEILEKTVLEPDAVSAYKKKCRELVDALPAQHHASRHEITVKYADVELEVTADDVKEVWTLRLAAILKSRAMQAGRIPKLPMEALLWSVQSEDPRLAQAVSDDHLAPYLPARAVALDMLSDPGVASLPQMEALLDRNIATLLALDGTFKLERSLASRAAMILDERLLEHALKLLPSQTQRITMRSSLHSFSTFLKSERASKGSAGAISKLESVLRMIDHMSHGIAPDVSARDSCPWFSRVLHRISHFLVATGADGKQVTGKEAMALKLDEVERCMASDDKKATVTLATMEPLQTFKWMLNAEQLQRVHSWSKEVLAASGFPMRRRGAGQSSSSSSSSTVPASSSTSPVTSAIATATGTSKRGIEGLSAQAQRDTMDLFK